MSTMHLQTLIANLAIVSLSGPVKPEQYGIPSEIFEHVTASTPWKADLRNACKAALDQLMQGGADNMGLPRMELPAEFIAACVAFYVHPINWLQAVNQYQKSVRQDALARGDLDPEYITGKQLYALMLMLGSSHIGDARSSYEKRIGIKLDKAVKSA